MTELARNLRCAIYTRKSTEEGLEQEFNSLHAQQEAAEAYIRSQSLAGWKVVDQHDWVECEDGSEFEITKYKLEKAVRSGA